MTAEISAAVICGWFVVDHSFDHLRLRTTWKQCLQEHPKASFSDTKAPKSLVNQGKNRYIFLWDVDAAGSNPVTPTNGKLPPPIIGDVRHKFLPHHTTARFGYYGFRSTKFGIH